MNTIELNMIRAIAECVAMDRDVEWLRYNVEVVDLTDEVEIIIL